MATATLSNITNKISTLISSSDSSIPELSDEQKMNLFLDSINELRTSLNNRSGKIAELEKQFVKITWLDIDKSDELKSLNEIFVLAEGFVNKTFSHIAGLRRKFWQKKICREEIKKYQSELELLEETIQEVKQIFSLRQDDEYSKLLNDLD